VTTSHLAEHPAASQQAIVDAALLMLQRCWPAAPAGTHPQA
jgi:hypothetical protein